MCLFRIEFIANWFPRSHIHIYWMFETAQSTRLLIFSSFVMPLYTRLYSTLLYFTPFHDSDRRHLLGRSSSFFIFLLLFLCELGLRSLLSVFCSCSSVYLFSWNLYHFDLVWIRCNSPYWRTPWRTRKNEKEKNYFPIVDDDCSACPPSTGRWLSMVPSCACANKIKRSEEEEKEAKIMPKQQFLYANRRCVVCTWTN